MLTDKIIKAVHEDIPKINSQLEQIAINVEMFGAKGDGALNDTQAIKNAIAYLKAKGGTLIFGKNKNYKIDEPLIFDFSNFNIDMNGSSFIWENYDKLTGNFASVRERHYGAITLKGEEIASTRKSIKSFIRHSNKYVYSIVEMDSNADYNVGDYVRIYCTIPGNNEKIIKPGFDIMCKVIEKYQATKIFVDYTSPFDFSNVDLNTFEIVKLNQVENVNIYNFRMHNNVVGWDSQGVVDGSNLNKCVSGIGINYGANINIYSPYGSRIQFPLVMVQHGYSIFVDKPIANWATHLGGGQGYTVHFCGVFNGKVNDAQGQKVRHVVDFSYSAFCELDGIKSSSSYQATFDLHGIWEHDITVNRCYEKIGLGNGTEYFPSIIANVNINNSNLWLITSACITLNLNFNNCKIRHLERTETMDFTEVNFNNCDFEVETYQVYFKCTYNSGRERVLKMNNCRLRGKSTDTIFSFLDFDKVIINSEVGTDGKATTLALQDVKNIDLKGSQLTNSYVRLYGEKQQNVIIDLSNIIYQITSNHTIKPDTFIGFSNSNKNLVVDLSNIKFTNDLLLNTTQYFINVNNINSTNNAKIIYQNNTLVDNKNTDKLKTIIRDKDSYITILNNLNNNLFNVENVIG